MSTNPIDQVTAINLQRSYYARTAEDYDAMHAFEPHRRSLWHIAAYLRSLGAKRVLDTGCGTGLAMRLLREMLPELELRGNDPSPELLRIATARHGIDNERLDCADSTALPYDDGQFDAVVETAVLHHVPEPDAVVSEMLRVARQAVFISDTNIYGQSSIPVGLLKFVLARAGLLETINRIRRGGKLWYSTEGDGIAWSYSVFDTVPMLKRTCSEVVVIPVSPARPFLHELPLLTSQACLIVGFKDPVTAAPR